MLVRLVLMPLRQIADVMDLAGQMVVAVGVVTVGNASRWLLPGTDRTATTEAPVLELIRTPDTSPAPSRAARRGRYSLDPNGELVTVR